MTFPTIVHAITPSDLAAYVEDALPGATVKDYQARQVWEASKGNLDLLRAVLVVAQDMQRSPQGLRSPVGFILERLHHGDKAWSRAEMLAEDPNTTIPASLVHYAYRPYHVIWALARLQVLMDHAKHEFTYEDATSLLDSAGGDFHRLFDAILDARCDVKDDPESAKQAINRRFVFRPQALEAAGIGARMDDDNPNWWGMKVANLGRRLGTKFSVWSNSDAPDPWGLEMADRLTDELRERQPIRLEQPPASAAGRLKTSRLKR